MAFTGVDASCSQRSSLSGSECQLSRGVKKTASFTRPEPALNSRPPVPRKAASFCIRVLATTTSAPRKQQFNIGCHPDAQRRRIEAERRRAVLQLNSEPFPELNWWDTERPSNMVAIATPLEFKQLLELGNLVIADFFVPWCQACRALYPKLKQIAKLNPDVLFLTVNGGADSELRDMCTQLGVVKLPYFHLYRDGELKQHFAANLTKVDKIRAEVMALKRDPFDDLFCAPDCANPMSTMPPI